MESTPQEVPPQAQSTHQIPEASFELMDPKYKKTPVDDQDQIHFTRGVVNIERFVTLINDCQIAPLNILLDVTVMYSVDTLNFPIKVYYYCSLAQFVQDNPFTNSYLESLVPAAQLSGSDDANSIIQLFLRFIPPEVFANECRKLMKTRHAMVRGMEHLISGQFVFNLTNSHFSSIFDDFCKFFKFQPLQIHFIDQVANQDYDINWEQLGFPDIHKVVYSFLMPSLLKYPQLLQLSKQLKDTVICDADNFAELHHAIDFQLRYAGHCSTTNGSCFYNKTRAKTPTSIHGESLMLIYKPVCVSTNDYSHLTQTSNLFASPIYVRNGDLKVTVLDKEFFRRKLRTNNDQTTGYLIGILQNNLHILLNHISIEDAHFQGYVMTAPPYELSVLTIESDNVTIDKIVNMFHLDLMEYFSPSKRLFNYSMYTFKNFVYKDLEGEERMIQLIDKLSREALAKSTPEFNAKYSNEWPHPGMNHHLVTDVVPIEAPPRQPHEMNIPMDTFQPNDPLLDFPFINFDTVPVTLTKDKLVSNLSQSLVEHCFDLISNDFFKALRPTHPVPLKPRSY